MIRIGIIGAGGIAAAHARAYKELPQVTVAGVCDVVPGKAEAFVAAQNLQGARAFQDHRDLLALDLDGVSICTPNAAHHRTAVDALRAGKHVLLEKPMSVTLEEAVDMVRVSRQTGKMLTVGFQPRYDPNMQLVREMVRSGALGSVYYVDTGAGRRRGMPGGTFIRKSLAGAGAVADIGCYALDFALDALGHPLPLTVSAATFQHFGTSPRYHPEYASFEVEDFGVAFVRLEGNIVLQFRTAWAMHMDTLGAAVFLGTDAGLKVTPAGEGPWAGAWDGGIGSITLFHDVAGQQVQTQVPLRPVRENRFFLKVKDFVDAIEHGRPAPIPGEQILRNQAIIDAILRSAALGREVEVEIPRI